MQSKDKFKPVQSIYHVLQLIETFRESASYSRELGVTELSKRLSLHKNNVFRLLATLHSRGYIEQNPETENYKLGINIFSLGQKFAKNLGLLNIAKPFMHEAAEKLDETLYIGILREGHAIYLDVVESMKAVQVVPRVGKDVPAYCTAIGKIQLAYASDEEINKMYMGARLKKYTKNTITSLPELKRHLDIVAKNDYAIDNEEFEEGVGCVAVPIKDYLGIAAAGLSLSSPSYRMTEEVIQKEVLPVLKRYAKEISKRLGYQGS
ncbi:MAG: IclR family transcriptional regulator [Deferribacterota bacterium]|nr:IclR family transcriptional regulator [Deferribacterota bacterium]